MRGSFLVTHAMRLDLQCSERPKRGSDILRVHARKLSGYTSFKVTHAMRLDLMRRMSQPILSQCVLWQAMLRAVVVYSSTVCYTRVCHSIMLCVILLTAPACARMLPCLLGGLHPQLSIWY